MEYKFHLSGKTHGIVLKDKEAHSMKKGSFSTLILILIFLVGLSMLLYPSVSDYWNSLHQSRAITEYAEQVANLDDDRYDELWQETQG